MVHTILVSTEEPRWNKFESENSPKGRYGHRAVVFQNKMILHGGYNGQDRLSETYEYDIEKRTWSFVDNQIKQQGKPLPSARDCHSAVLYDNKMIIFGGGDGYRWLNDIWQYNISTQVWTEIKPNELPEDEAEVEHMISNSGSFVDGSAPASSRSQLLLNCLKARRNSHNSTSSLRQQFVSPGVTPATPTTTTSSQGLPAVVPPPVMPAGRAGHSAVMYKHRMLVFGGWNGRRTLNDMYEFNMLTREWRVINAKGHLPQSRDSHTAVVYGNKMIVVGGGDGKQRLNDMHEFDLVTETWSRLKCAGEVNAGRAGHVAVQFEDKMIIFGGGDGQKWLSDVYECDLKARKWSLVENKHEQKIAPGSYGLSAVLHKHQMIVFGGGDGKAWYNSVYEYTCGDRASIRAMKAIMWRTCSVSNRFTDCGISFAHDDVAQTAKSSFRLPVVSGSQSKPKMEPSIAFSFNSVPSTSTIQQSGKKSL